MPLQLFGYLETDRYPDQAKFSAYTYNTAADLLVVATITYSFYYFIPISSIRSRGLYWFQIFKVAGFLFDGGFY